VFPVRYEYHFHMKSKDIRVIGRTDLCRQVTVAQSVWFARGLRATEFVFVCLILRIPHCVDSQLGDAGEIVSLTQRSRTTH
jgi:hypothetical protein